MSPMGLGAFLQRCKSWKHALANWREERTLRATSASTSPRSHPPLPTPQRALFWVGKDCFDCFKGMIANVLDAFATRDLSSSPHTVISASTKISLLPARKTCARQYRSEPEAGRKNETLFSTVMTSWPSRATVAAAPPHVWSASVIRTPAWTNPCCCASLRLIGSRVSHQPAPDETKSIPRERTNCAPSKICRVSLAFPVFIF